MPRSAAPRQWLAAVFDVTGQVAAKQAFRSASDWYLAKGRGTLRPSRSEGSHEIPDAGRARVSLRGIRARRPVGRASSARPQDPSSRPVLPDPPSAPDAPRRIGHARRASPVAVDRGDVRRLRGRLEQRGAEAARGAGRLCGQSAVRRDGAAARLPLRRAQSSARRRQRLRADTSGRAAVRCRRVRRDSRLAGRASARACADQPSLASASLACGCPPVRPACRDGGSCLHAAGCSRPGTPQRPKYRSGPSWCSRSRT